MFSNLEDDDFSDVNSSSNLASLFGTSMTIKEGIHTSLSYKAPKQPRPSPKNEQVAANKALKPQTSVISSKLVNVYKVINENFSPTGKCGLAVIGNSSLKAYEIIIYKTKEDIITRTRIKSEFTFTLQVNNVAIFVDDHNQHWSVHFENDEQMYNFAHEIQILGAKITGITENSAKSSIILGSEPKLVNNNEKSICSTADKTETNLLTSSTVKRDNEIEAKSSAEILRKHPGDIESDLHSDSSGSNKRANILSRMAKMGQQILPSSMQKESNTISDSESDIRESKKPLRKPKRNHTNNNDKITVPVESTLQLQHPKYILINGQYVPCENSSTNQNFNRSFVHPNQSPNLNICTSELQNQFVVGHPQISQVTDQMHIFIAENRTHNCEIRMNLSQISSKLDQVLNNSNSVKSACKTDDALESRLKILELQILNWGTNSEKKSEKVETDNPNVNVTNNAVEDELQSLKQENYELKLKMAEFDVLQQEREELKRDNLCLHQQINNLQSNTVLTEKYESDIQQYQNDLEEKQNLIKILSDSLEEQQQKINTLEQLCGEKDKSSNTIINDNLMIYQKFVEEKELFVRELKESMNLMFMQVFENFGKNDSLERIHIEQALKENIKRTTYKIIQQLHTCFKHIDRHMQQNLNYDNIPDTII